MSIVPDTIAAFREQYPTLNPYGIYCLLTGRLMSNHPVREIHELIESMIGDAEERADELATRIVAAARPSLRWNSIRPTGINQMRKRYPVDTLCYLLNGGHGVPNHLDFFAAMLDRISQHYEASRLTDEELESCYLIFYLDEEDAIGESEIAARRMRNWLKSVTPAGAEASRLQRLAAIEAEAALIREGKIKRWQRPVSERTQKKREHDKKLSMANAFLDSLLSGKMPETAAAPPSASPQRPAGVGFKIRIPAKGA